MQNSCNIIIVLGHTASGKTKLAAHLAHRLHTEVISADSRQLYKGLDIGTGKDLGEYVIDGHLVTHHLIDTVEAGTHYDLDRYKKDFAIAFNSITARGLVPIWCGGTPLYFYSLLTKSPYTQVPVDRLLRQQLENFPHEELVKKFHSLSETSFHPLADLSTKKRTIRAIEIAGFLNNGFQIAERNAPELNPLIIGLKLEPEIREKQIVKRLEYRLENGLIEEVEGLLKSKMNRQQLEYLGLEYKYVSQFVAGETEYSEMVGLLTVAIRQFAKRQMTFFRKMEREGFLINWMDASSSFNEVLGQSWQLISRQFR